MRKLLSLIACLVMGSAMLMAQTVVTGTVISSEDGEPIIGAAVLVTGTTTGTTTDFDGKFSLKVPSDAKSLTVSYVGMAPQNVALDHSDKPVFIKLVPSNVLDDVVVTAQGISRSEKSLGYSATTLKAGDLTVGNNANAMTSLQGKVAGMQVSAQSSAPGSTNNVIIRGFSSINGSNQPLYVIDGVPMDQTVISSQGQNLAAGGISNMSPDDIESMTVLKGAAATALYGSRAANGVILVTTKAGKRGVGRNYQLEYSYGLQANQVSYLPTMQNKFGQGWNGAQTWIENGSWGPEFDGSLQVYGPIWNHQQLIHKYSAVKNNVYEFFETGINQTHNASINGVSEDGKMNYFLSYNYTDQNGIMPSDADVLKRNTISMRANYEPNKWLKVSSSMNFAKSKLDAVGTYQGTSVIDGILELPRDISLLDKKNLNSAFNTPEAYMTPYGITNPYWAIANNYNHTDSKQVFGKVQADIKPYKDVTLTYRFGFDYTDYDRKLGYPEIALDDALIDDDMGYAPSNMNQAGYVYANYGRRYELNHDISANYNNLFLDKRLNVSVTAGLNVNERARTVIAGETDELTFYTGFWDLSNGATKKTLEESQSKRRLVGLWGNVALSWMEKIFLDLTARNDWSSTLPINDNSFFYPGATVSYLFTEDLPENEILTFGKVRMAFGKTGNDANPYRTQSAFTQAFANGYYGSNIAKFPMNGVNAFVRDSWNGSNTLKPEMTTEFEIGANLGFFDGRIAVDASYYNRTTNDQIFTLPVDPATGFSSMVTNFGKVSNKGVELVLNTIPVQTKNWKWTLDFNWSKNNNKVESLPESLEGGKVSIYDFSAGNDAIQMYAEVGKPMGQFYTYRTAYVDNGEVNYEGRGKMLVDEYGQPVLSSEIMDTGKNMNNKWTGGINTSVTAYGVTLSAQLDVRYGGHMFSRTRNLMQFTGNSDVTTYNNRRPFIIPNSVVAGEDANGNTVYEANTTPIYMSDGSYQKYFNDYGAGLGGEFYLLDRSFAKLRNITLSYALPRKWLAPTQLSAVSLSVFVNNAFIWTAKANRFLDPENTTVSQSSYGDLATQFGELYSNPSCRTYGFNINVKF